MQGDFAHINELICTWGMLTKIGLTISYKLYSEYIVVLLRHPLSTTYSYNTNITQPMYLVSRSRSLHRQIPSPGGFQMFSYNILYHMTIFKGKIIKYQLAFFVKCRKPDGILLFLNRKCEAVRHEQVLKREHLSFCHDIPLIAGRKVGGRTVWRKSSTVYQCRQKQRCQFLSVCTDKALCLTLSAI